MRFFTLQIVATVPTDLVPVAVSIHLNSKA